MATPDQSFQICPTRIDGSPVLFAHKVDKSRCQERQRGRYHKCFTCAWNNNYVAIHGEPQVTPEVVAASDEVVTETVLTPAPAEVVVTKVG